MEKQEKVTTTVEEVEDNKIAVNNSIVDPITRLSNALTPAIHLEALTDLAKQTLLDVQSQPLLPTLLPALTVDFDKPETSAPTFERQDNNDAPLIDSSSALIKEFYEQFAVGKIFQSLTDLRATAFAYGKKHNVALTTSKSDKTKAYLTCKHGGAYRKNNSKNKQATTELVKKRIRKSQKTGCSCIIYARCNKGLWSVRKSIGEHNHPIAIDPRAYAMYRSLDPDQMVLVHKMLKENTGIANIVKDLKALGVNNILPKDIENIQQDLKRKANTAPAAANTATNTTIDTDTNVITTLFTTSSSTTVLDSIPNDIANVVSAQRGASADSLS